MNLKTELLREYSKSQVNRIVRYIGNDPIRFKELVNLYLEGPYRVTQRASWPMSYCIEAHPKLVNPHLKTLLDYAAKRTATDAIKRNTVRFLQFAPIPKRYYGRVADLCFGFLENKKEAIAIRVFSLTVLSRIIGEEPDLKHALRLIIEDNLPYASPAFRVRAREVMKMISN